MSALGERTLMLLLTDTDSLQSMVKEGLQPKVIPTMQFREVYDWSIRYFRQSKVAPSIEVMKERFGDLFTDHGVDMDSDIEETVEWAIEDLKQSYIQMEIGLFSRKLATEVATASPEDRVEVAGTLSAELNSIILAMQPRTSQIDLREAGSDLMDEYDEIASAQGEVRGMSLGLPRIDQQLGGIWNGELAIMAGPPGTGKSFFANFVAHAEWKRDRVVALFTLENSILMTQMRIACQALNVDINKLQSGTLSETDTKMLREWCGDVLVKSDTPLHIINPQSSLRSPESLIQVARSYEADSVIIDQLTFMQPVKADRSRPREIGEMLHSLKSIISTGRDPLPCLLMHQINREGVKAAAATGRLDMTHMAEGSEVERTGDHVMSLYQSQENLAVNRMQIQQLKERRVKPVHWDLDWQPWIGRIFVRDEVSVAMIDPDNPPPPGQPEQEAPA